MHSIPRAFRESAPFYLVATLMASALIFGFAWTFTWSQGTAEKTARDEGGLTRVTSSERQLFAWCRKGYVGYTVKGYRGEKPVTVKVCATLPTGLSYVR